MKMYKLKKNSLVDKYEKLDYEKLFFNRYFFDEEK